MAITKSEQTILDAFAFQREQYPDRTPTYAARGKRMLRAAELLVAKGLAEVAEREKMSTKYRGRTTTYVYLHVNPAPEAKSSRKPKKEPTKVAKRTATRIPKKKPEKKHAAARKAKRPHPISRLRKAVEQSDLSDRELAKRTGISQPVITRFRNGTRGLTFENAARLASFLKFRFET